MLQASDGALWTAYDCDARPRRRGLRRPRRGAGRPEHLAGRARGRACTWPSSPTTPPAPPTRSPSTCASSGSRPPDDDVVTSAQAAARLLADRLADGCRGRSSSAARACEARSREPGCAPVQDAEERAGRRGRPGFTPDVRWSTVIVRRDPGPRRAAVGGVQHRPDRPDRRTAWRRATARWSSVVARFAGGEPGGGRQAGAAAVRGDRAPGRRRPAAGGRRPARHRHRGRQPAGYDSLLVMTGVTGLGRAAWPPSRSCGRRTSRPTSAGLAAASRTRRAGDGDRRSAGGWTAEVDDGGRLARSTGDGRRRRLVAGRRRPRPGATSTPTGEPVDVDGARVRRVA